jgi:hypothetical protein
MITRHHGLANGQTAIWLSLLACGAAPDQHLLADPALHRSPSSRSLPHQVRYHATRRSARVRTQTVRGQARAAADLCVAFSEYDTARKSSLPIPTPIWRLPAIVQRTKNVSPLRSTVTVPEYVEPFPGLVPDTRYVPAGSARDDATVRTRASTVPIVRRIGI